MQKLALGVAWLLSLAVTAWLSIVLTRPTAGTPAAPVVAQAADEKLSNARFSGELHNLQDENAKLHAQLDTARKATLQQAMAELLRRAKDSSNANTDAHAAVPGRVLTQLVDGARRNTGMFGNLDESIRALVTFGQMGDKGVEFLLAVVNDAGAYTEEERKQARELLFYLPHPDVLKYSLSKATPSPDNMEADFEYAGAVLAQVESLPGSEIAPLVSELNSLAGQWMDEGRADIMCSLALVHGNSAALNRLQETLKWPPESFLSVVNKAERIHTNEALTFLNDAERRYQGVGLPNDPDFRMQDHISKILERW